MLTRDPRSLLQRDTWQFLAKLSLVLTIETLLAPGIAMLVRLDRFVDPRRVLSAQNMLRRAALLWMFPQFGENSRSGLGGHP